MIDLEASANQIRTVSERTLGKYQDSFTPIFVSRETRKNYAHESPTHTHPFMSIGTGIYVLYESKPWLITANHVIANAEKDYYNSPLYVRSSGSIQPLFKGSEKIIIVRMASEDVAAIPLFSDENLEHNISDFIDLDLLPEVEYSNQFRMAIYGYANKTHIAVRDEINPSQYLTMVGSMSDKQTPAKVFLEFNRKGFEGDIKDRNFVPEPNGLSGGPVFAMETAHQIHEKPEHIGTFCGLFLEQSDKGNTGSALFVPLNCLKSCLSSSLDELNVVTN